VDDAALIGVDHGDEVGRLDARASVQAGEVQKHLQRRMERLLRRAVEGSGLLVFRVHLSSFQGAAVVLTAAHFFAEAAPRVFGENAEGGRVARWSRSFRSLA
jgi:hypothetical protein